MSYNLYYGMNKSFRKFEPQQTFEERERTNLADYGIIILLFPKVFDHVPPIFLGC